MLLVFRGKLAFFSNDERQSRSNHAQRRIAVTRLRPPLDRFDIRMLFIIGHDLDDLGNNDDGARGDLSLRLLVIDTK